MRTETESQTDRNLRQAQAAALACDPESIWEAEGARSAWDARVVEFEGEARGDFREGSEPFRQPHSFRDAGR